MSSYIVDDETINTFLSWKIGELVLDPDKMGGYEFDKSDLTELGQACLKLNIEATNQRYLENDEEKERIGNFRFQFMPTNRYQALSSLRCFLYQCSEGDIPETPLYKALDELSNRWAWDIVNELPQYNAAKWG